MRGSSGTWLETEQRTYGWIYLILHLETGRYYVGQTKRLPSTRWAVHCSEAKLRPRSKFHKAIAKYGRDAFEMQVLGSASDAVGLDKLEISWILVLGACNRERGYNLGSGGRTRHWTAEARASHSARLRGRVFSIAHRLAISRYLKGRKQTQAHIDARAAALRGRTPSFACRLAVAESNRRRAAARRTA